MNSYGNVCISEVSGYSYVRTDVVEFQYGAASKSRERVGGEVYSVDYSLTIQYSEICLS